MITGTMLAPAAFAALALATLQGCAPECTHLLDCPSDARCSADGVCVGVEDGEAGSQAPTWPPEGVRAGAGRPPDTADPTGTPALEGAILRGDIGGLIGVDTTGAARLDTNFGVVTIEDPRAGAFVGFGLASTDMDTLLATPGSYDVAGDDAYAYACTTDEVSVAHFDEMAVVGTITVEPIAPPSSSDDPPQGTVTVRVDISGAGHDVLTVLRVAAPPALE